MATHYIEPERRTLHGPYDRDLEPAVTIDPGDTVMFRTLDAGWGLEPHGADGTRRRFGPRDPARDGGHALCGPVSIRGAEPGMTLEVRFNEIRPGAWGWNSAGGWKHEINERLGLVDSELLVTWTLDPDAMTGTSCFGHTVRLQPFMGNFGMPPADHGKIPTWAPRVNGGNFDCKDLAAGSSMFLPVAVPGGLFSVGDGHAAQGDGEVSVTAIEAPMERVSITFNVRPDLQLTAPRAQNAEGWLTFGFHEDLNEATFLALEGMLDLMREQFGVKREYALALASVAVDLRITQICNGVKGVHAVLPHGAIQ